RLLFMLVLPLLFSALVVGVAEMGDLKVLGRAGIKSLLFTVLVSTIAVVIGLVMVNLFRPGAGVDPPVAAQLLEQGKAGAYSIVQDSNSGTSGINFFVELIPSNVFKVAADNDILPVMVFALLFGVGVVMVRNSATDHMLKSLEGLFEVMMK